MKPLALLLLPLLGGCASLFDTRVQMDPPPVVQLPDTQSAAPANGAIFQAASYRPLFEQHRARLVGDTLTVSIQERVNASQSSSSKADRSGALAAAVTAVPGVAANSFGRASAGATSSNVNVVEELVQMIQTQRAYELNSKAVQTSDQMLQRLSQI